MTALLEVEHLKSYFKTPRGYLHAVDDVSFSVQEGSTIGVVGESGCGKSTLGRTILHLRESTDGVIRFEGKDITHVHKAELKKLRQQMQMIFQDPYSSLDPRKSVQRIIAEPLRIYRACENAEALRARVLELMDMVGLSADLLESYPHEMDGGRRQRIGIARALAMRPRFIVCDEPVSALDVSIQAQILNLLQDLQQEQKLTYLFITHNLSVVKHISTEIIVMYLGCMVEHCETEELFENPRHPYTRALLSSIPSIDLDRPRTKETLKGELSSPIEPGEGCRFAPRCKYAKKECFTHTPEWRNIGGEHYVACHRSDDLL